MILWYIGNELILGDLEKNENNYSFVPIQSVTVSVPSSPLVVKSTASREILFHSIKSIISKFRFEQKVLEIWLTPEWAYMDRMPVPDVPIEDFVPQIRWEIEQRVNDVLEKYFLFQKQIPNEGIVFAVMRPSIVKFWRQLLFEFDFKLSALRIAEPNKLQDALIFDFATRGQGIPPPLTTTETKESGLSYHFSKKNIPIWLWVILIALLIAGGVYLWKPWLINTKVFTKNTRSVVVDSLLHQTSKTDTSRNVASSEVTPAKHFARIIDAMQHKIATVEGATLVPGLIHVQLITNVDKTEQIAGITTEIGVNADIRFSAQTNRMLILIPISEFAPSKTFEIKSDSLIVSENSVEGPVELVTQWISTLQELPYRMVYVRESKGARVVTFR